MVFARIAALLNERMGLDAESIGAASVERAVRARSTALGLDDPELYWKRLTTSESELQELIEAVVIPETWFFRDPEAFTALVRTLGRRQAEGPWRLLSLPCSTGEEPFSIAMALLDAGLPPQRFQIDAIDISRRALAYAERGLYGRNSFRAKDLGFRERYFEPLEHGVSRLKDVVRQPVHFRHGNLLAPGALEGSSGYHAIFCRNVLIYFDRPMQDRAIDVLTQCLMPGGLLFVGPSETSLLLDHGLVSAGIPLAFAFRRAEPTALVTKVSRSVVPAIAPARPASDSTRRKPVAAARPQPKVILETPTPEKPAPAPENWIEHAQRLADEGNLAEALQCCEQNLRDQPASAEALHLMGMLHDAAGRVDQAAEHYRKALYLDPQHPEALVHLAVALQKGGDARGAQRLIDRAKRQSALGEGKRRG